MIEAGSKVKTLPPLCRGSFDWRLIPEQVQEWAKRRICEVGDELKAGDPDSDYSVRSIMEAEPVIVSRDTKLVAAFQPAGKACLGQESEFTVSPGSDDQRFVVHQGGLADCVVYGPGPLAQAHKADEFVSIAELKSAAKIMARASLPLLGAA